MATTNGFVVSTLIVSVLKEAQFPKLLRLGRKHKFLGSRAVGRKVVKLMLRLQPVGSRWHFLPAARRS